jgi:hypothetical protein
MEMTQRNSLCSCLKQTNCHFFVLFYKIGEQEGGTNPAWGFWYGGEVGKGVGG